LVKQVVPSDKSFYEKYAGIFHFRFWRFGRWYDVVIDDRLPTLNGALHSTKAPNNVFWPALLDKAYLKFLYGGYINNYYFIYEVLQDFTGGVVEHIDLRCLPKSFENTLLKAFARQSLIGCASSANEVKTPQGLVRDHAYAMTGARFVNVPGRGEVLLIRLRNPWGSFEWNGAWSDGSKEWELLPKALKEELAVVNREDGEFVMEFSDFVSNFAYVDICHLSPNVHLNVFGQNTEVRQWHLDMVKGSWIKGVTSGGFESLHENPQIWFTLSEADGDNDGNCTVLIALLQKTTRLKFLKLGFKVYHISDLNQPALEQDFLKNNQPVGSVDLTYIREVVGRYEIRPGTNCVIPFTKKGISGDFFFENLYGKETSNYVLRF
ncbi:calpain-A-like, partial [Macrosteles quadrilineatus]|uniref:calpain-A-like n=1 Tax=Macrosteles quadrilineatus TaxID=74068 RepID=UPI0023E2170C